MNPVIKRGRNNEQNIMVETFIKNKNITDTVSTATCY